MEGLNLSYKDVFEVIPYSCLLVMQVDKIRVVTSSDNEEKETSGEKLLKRKRNG